MENWEPLFGCYEVSDKGHIRHIEDRRHRKRQFVNRSRYVGGGIKTFQVHRLVAEAFHPDHPGKDIVNHINGDRKDNRACNLEWCTRAENSQKAIDGHQLRHTPVRCLETGKGYYSVAEAARDVGARTGSLWACLSGKAKTCRGFHWAKG